MCGYIKLHRQILEWEWYDDINMTRLFMHLLLKANFQDKKWKGITIRRGSFVTSLDSLNKETGLSTQNIRTCLAKLKKSKEITIKTTNKYRVITLISYELYQADNKQLTNNQQAINNQITDEKQTNNKPLTTTKEVKKDNSLEKDNLTVIKKEKQSFSSKTRGTRFKAERTANNQAIIPEEFSQFTQTEGVSEKIAEEQFQRFTDYWEGLSGQKAVKVDWLATWRNWIRRFKDHSASKQLANSSTTFDDVAEYINANPLSHERPKSLFSK